MKRIYALPCLIFVMMLSFSASFGQTTIDAEFRPRTEFREGFRKPLADTLNAGLVTLQRTRLNCDYKGKILNARLSLEDARIWGNTDIKTNNNKVGIYEAWFEYLIASGFSMQMGRQPLKYDDQRILSAPSWSNVGVTHDVMVLKYKNPFIQVHSGYAYNNSKDTLMNVTYGYTFKQNYKAMGYLWLSKQVHKATTLSLIGLLEGFEKKADIKVVYPRFTYGGNLVYTNDSSDWGATLTFYKQHGKDPNKAFGLGYANLDAFFFAAKISCKIAPKFTANLGIDYYSGSASDINASKSNTFNRLYGSVHAFNGYMEYYSTLPTQGLVDYYGGINTKINQRFSVELTGHVFSFDKDFIYNKVKTNKSLGAESDLVINFTASKEITIQGGYSRYFNSDSTAKYFKMQGVDAHPQQWAYVMFTIKPQFYKTPPSTESKL